jgi:F-type H+-transporting ATPase subunit a
MINSPLEQFELISLLPITFLNFDFSITNLLIINLIALMFFVFVIHFVCLNINDSNNNSFFVIPNSWQIFVETLYDVVSQLLFDNINLEGEKYFPYISMIFLYILFSNLVGLIPYSFTATSHIVITFTLSFSIFIGVNIIGFQKHKLNMLSLIIPANSTLLLALVLVPIEFVSYIAKPISLGVRLFINLMAGHTLLKVIVGFAWSMLLLEDLIAIVHLVPLFLLVILMGLELGVALIQAYVFTILICIYLNDSVNLH